MPDLFAPNFCFEDCFVAHAFQWQNGALTDLGAIPGGGSSVSTWITPNGLIAGLSQTGGTDPLFSGLPDSSCRPLAERWDHRPWNVAERRE